MAAPRPCRVFLGYLVASCAGSAAVSLEDAPPGSCGSDAACRAGPEVEGSGINRDPGEDGHHYPSRAANALRSGCSPHVGPRDLSKPAWIHEFAGFNRHQTPVIDKDFNVYTGSDMGFVISYTKDGTIRWYRQVGPKRAQSPAILGGLLYVGTGDGYVSALNLSTGEVMWRTSVSTACGEDAYSVTAVGGRIILPVGRVLPFGSPEVVALNATTGRYIWRYSVARKLGRSDIYGTTVNLAAPVVGDAVFLSDVTGGIHKLSATDGRELWFRAGERPESYTLGGVSVGPNNVLYNGFSIDGNRGVIKALDGSTGEVLWRRELPQEVHAAPAIGPLGPGGPLAVVFGTGVPLEAPEPTVAHVLFHFASFLREYGVSIFASFIASGLLGMRAEPAPTSGTVYAMDARTGEELWTFTPPAWKERVCAGSTWEQPCMPDLWSAPTIGGDGTVYINWSAGGVTYRLRDANGDGAINSEDPAEVLGYDAASAATGPPAIAPGMLTVTTCRKQVTFLG